MCRAIQAARDLFSPPQTPAYIAAAWQRRSERIHACSGDFATPSNASSATVGLTTTLQRILHSSQLVDAEGDFHYNSFMQNSRAPEVTQ